MYTYITSDEHTAADAKSQVRPGTYVHLYKLTVLFSQTFSLYRFGVSRQSRRCVAYSALYCAFDPPMRRRACMKRAH